MFYTEYIKQYRKTNTEDRDNSFTNLIHMCKERGKNFGDALLEYDIVDRDILFCYLKIAMTSTATVKFKERMTYEKFSDAVTVFEEAFAVLALENNFDRWIYFAEKKLKEKKKVTIDEDVSANSNDHDEDQSGTSYSDDSGGDSDKSVENIPDVLYQQKVKKRKDKRETAGKWTTEGMNRLNSLITMVQDGRNGERREQFEEELQDMYIKHADKNMELMAKNKRKREMDEMNSRKKGVVIQNVLDFVAL